MYQGTISTLIYTTTFIQYSNKGQINSSLISKNDEKNINNRRLIKLSLEFISVISNFHAIISNTINFCLNFFWKGTCLSYLALRLDGGVSGPLFCNDTY